MSAGRAALRHISEARSTFAIGGLKKRENDDCQAQSSVQFRFSVHVWTFAARSGRFCACSDDIVNSQDHIGSFHRGFDRV